MLLSLPILVIVNVALLLPGLSDRPALAVGLGVAGGVGASPVGALVGFALAWTRWGHLTNQHPAVMATAGHVVVVARGSTPPAQLTLGLSPDEDADGRLGASQPGGGR